MCHEGWRSKQKLAGFLSSAIKLGLPSVALLFALVLRSAGYKVVGSDPTAAKYLLIGMFNLGIANGTRVRLKLRLETWLV